MLNKAEADQPSWNEAIKGWIARARKGIGVAGGPDPDRPTRTMYFYQPGFWPYGGSWGAPFPPTLTCDKAPEASPSPLPSASPGPSVEPPASAEPSPEASVTPKPAKTPKPAQAAEADAPSRPSRPSRPHHRRR